MLGENISQEDQLSSTGEEINRKRKQNCNDTPPVSVEEVAQHSAENKVQVDFEIKLDKEYPVSVEEVAQHSAENKVQVDFEIKLDKEYPEWRKETTKKTFMVPCIFVNKGKKNAKNGADAERTLFDTLKCAKKAAPMDAYFSIQAANYENGSCFVFHGQKYEGTEVDFIRISIYGVTVFECKGITRAEQAQDSYDDACSQQNDSIPKLELDDDIPVNRVVAFPLCKRTEIDHDGDTRTLFKEDCEDSPSFNKWLEKSYQKKYFSAKKLTFEKYLEIVQHFLFPYHTRGNNFLQYKTRIISDTADCLERVTKKFYYKEQAAVLQDESYQNFWIDGCAGSGKTFLLKERVRWLAENYKDKKKLILVVTYNAAINKEIELALKDVEGPVRVQTFRALLCHILWPEPSNGSEDAGLVKKILQDPKILQKHFKKKDVCKYRHILIDEAQDLSGDWLQMFKHLLNKGKPSNIWVFSDPYQVVRREIQMPEKDELSNFEKRHITRVVRNPHEVFEAYEYYFEENSSYNFKPIVGHDVYGETPEYIPAESEVEMNTKLLQKLKELQEKKVSLLDIAIITQGQGHSNFTQSSASDVLKKFLESNKILCTDAEEGTKIRYKNRKPSDPTVIVDTVQRFKGLESKILIFCIVGNWQPRDVDFYVGFSRAFCHLIVLGKSRIIAGIQNKTKKVKDQE